MIWLLMSLVWAQDGTCANEGATFDYREGYRSQQAKDTENAIASYSRCIEKDPTCVPCHYEIGWSYWTRSEWNSVIAAWEKVLSIDPNHQATKTWLPQARGNKANAKPAVSANGLRVPIGVRSAPASAPVKMELVARFQNYNPNPTSPADHHDTDVHSPKSARFLSNGSKVYVNSLEGLTTVVYDPKSLQKIGTIRHTFEADDAGLFQGQTTAFEYPYFMKSPSGDPNQFSGKPVESALSHNEKYLWVPYYRREFDVGARSPSAVAVIDTATDTVVRVLPTGPIPKYVAISPDNRWAAITHWGDNTVALIDISSGDPAKFQYRDQRLVVERILPQAKLGGDRDASCGFCLRGTTFTPDGKTLLVARMGGGGIAGFDVESGSYLGTVDGDKPTPRHLVIGPDKDTLYFTSNRSGYVSKHDLSDLVDLLRADGDGHVVSDGFAEVFVGGGARTLEMSGDGKWLFVALNSRAQVGVVNAETLEVVSRIRADSYTVGLAVSPDGSQVWTTSQGRRSGGGNSVCVFGVTYD